MTLLISDESAAIALCAEGAVLSEAGDLAAAIARYEQAVNVAPAVLELHLILANAQQLAGRPLDARATLRHALRVAARADAVSDFALGKALIDAGAGADAVGCFRRVRAEYPGDAAAASALAAALREAQQPDDAWTEVSAALRMAPQDPVVLLTAALIRHDLSDFAGALEFCDRSLAIRPDASGVHVTRGYLRHLLGDESGAWTDFESRTLPEPSTATPRWRGEALDGKSILVIGEQGVGDQFQFLRFVHHPSLGAASRVIVACQPEAVPLLRASGYNAVARDETVFADYYVPMLSLPLLLGVNRDWRGAGSTYIATTDAPTVAHPRATRVGLVWAGNPEHRNDAVRSLPPSLLHGLLHTQPRVQFVSMQHGVAATDLPPGIAAHHSGGDWLATARELCTLDLLITVDTGIAHLAGALGMSVWLLVPHVPDWRWGACGSRTPWYPSVRLFRQPARGDWSRVLTNVSAALSSAVLSAR